MQLLKFGLHYEVFWNKTTKLIYRAKESFFSKFSRFFLHTVNRFCIEQLQLFQAIYLQLLFSITVYCCFPHMCGKQPLGTVFHTCDGKQQLKQIRTVDRGGRPLKMGLGPFFQKKNFFFKNQNGRLRRPF